jgi:hypothetical protein
VDRSDVARRIAAKLKPAGTLRFYSDEPFIRSLDRVGFLSLRRHRKEPLPEAPGDCPDPHPGSPGAIRRRRPYVKRLLNQIILEKIEVKIRQLVSVELKELFYGLFLIGRFK